MHYFTILPLLTTNTLFTHPLTPTLPPSLTIPFLLLLSYLCIYLFFFLWCLDYILSRCYQKKWYYYFFLSVLPPSTNPAEQITPILAVTNKHNTPNNTITNSTPINNKNIINNTATPIPATAAKAAVLSWKPTILVVDDSGTNRKMLVPLASQYHLLFNSPYDLAHTI